jgi:hypothetical protein
MYLSKLCWGTRFYGRDQALYRLDLLLGRERYPGGWEVFRSRIEPLDVLQHEAFDGPGGERRRRAVGLARQSVAGADVAACLRVTFLGGAGGHGRAAETTVEDALEQGGLAESQVGFLAVTPEQGLDLGKGGRVTSGPGAHPDTLRCGSGSGRCR